MHQRMKNLAVDNHNIYTPTLYYHYTPRYTWKVRVILIGYPRVTNRLSTLYYTP